MPSIELFNTGGGGGSGGGGGGGNSGGSEEARKAKQCEDATRSADRERSDCVVGVNEAAELVLDVVCESKTNHSVDLTFTVGGKILGFDIGGGLDRNNYDRCVNRLNASVATSVARCGSARDTFVEEVCND